MPDERTPVAILGAGIIGICTALSLLERGVSVTLIDRGAPGQETSHGNAGVVSPWSIIPQSQPGTWKNIPKLLFGYGRPLSFHPNSLPQLIPWGLRFLQLGQEKHMRRTAEAMSHLCSPSIQLYRKHLAGTGHESLLIDSCYIHAFRKADRASLQDLEYRIRAEMGADMELIGHDRLRLLEPALSPAFKAAIVIKGQARARAPGRLGAVLAEKAQRLGAEIKRAEITGLARDSDGWTVLCKEGTIRTGRIIICLGAWSPQFLKSLPIKIPLMAERGYHTEFADPGIEIFNSVLDADAKVVASSMEGGVRVAGQAEFAPLDAPPSKRREKRLEAVARAAFPDLNMSSPKAWMGRRPSFPDSLPMIDTVPGQPGLYLNFGHSHYGLMMAPASGEIAARLVTNTPGNEQLDAVSSTRF